METRDEEYDTPLHKQRPFGGGRKRQKIAFVAASSGTLETVTTTPETSSTSIGDLYLSIVQRKDPVPSTEGSEPQSQDAQVTGKAEQGPSVCPVCKLPLPEDLKGKISHETSLAHQVCMEHSHPPSAIDRSRMGLAYLESYGYDPDTRLGLGREGQGIQHPIKAQPKHDTLGLGVVVPKEFKGKKPEKPVLLDAGKVRKKAAEEKKRHEKLTREFYGNPDIEKYLTR